MRRHFLALGTIAFMSLAPQAFAATAINVIEDGEGGGPMSLKMDQSIIKAGEVVFSVHNAAMTEEHEMVLVKLKSADQKITVIKGIALMKSSLKVLARSRISNQARTVR